LGVAKIQESQSVKINDKNPKNATFLLTREVLKQKDWCKNLFSE